MNKILIVDDERFEREQLCQILGEAFPHEVQTRTAENGREAVETAILWQPVLVLMDIEMPGVDGIEAAKRILTQLPACKILFVTAYSLFHYAYEAVKMGACDYILKPVDPADVIRAVRRCLDQAETEEDLKAMVPVAETLAESTSLDKTSLLMTNVKKYLQHNYMRRERLIQEPEHGGKAGAVRRSTCWGGPENGETGPRAKKEKTAPHSFAEAQARVAPAGMQVI